ncbi:MAG: permease-like cell division protein FtsX [Candidatus Dormiibacterota bacterium]
MRISRHLRFALSSAWQSFFRNATVSITAVVSICLILILGGVNLMVGHGLSQVLDNYRQQVSVLTISVADGTPMPSVLDFEARLQARPDVQSVDYLTKAQVLAQLASDPRNQQLLEQVQGNPVPARIEVHMKSLAAVQRVNVIAKQWPGADPVDPTDYQGGFIANMLRLSDWLTFAGLGLLAILVVISVVIVMNTIRTAVYHRRREIEVMKLVGATEWFVRGPFVLEGILTGLLAAGLALGVVMLGYHPFVNRFKSELFFIPLSYDPHFVSVLGLYLLAAGALLGALGSYIGVRRYVRV